MLDSIAASASDSNHFNNGLASYILIYHFEFHKPS
jgi:hypothetical protein